MGTVQAVLVHLHPLDNGHNMHQSHEFVVYHFDQECCLSSHATAPHFFIGLDADAFPEVCENIGCGNKLSTATWHACAKEASVEG